MMDETTETIVVGTETSLWSLTLSGHQVQKLADLPSSTNSYGILAIGSCVYIIGGCKDRNVADFWRYDSKHDKWTQLESMNMPIMQPNCCTNGEKIYVFRNFADVDATLLQYYDLELGGWTSSKIDIPRANIVRGVFFYQSVIIALVRNHRTQTLTMESYLPEDDLWGLCSVFKTLHCHRFPLDDNILGFSEADKMYIFVSENIEIKDPTPTYQVRLVKIDGESPLIADSSKPFKLKDNWYVMADTHDATWRLMRFSYEDLDWIDAKDFEMKERIVGAISIRIPKQ